jgi:hypothetical protein
VQDVRQDADELGEGDRAPLVEAEQLAVHHPLARAVLAAAQVQHEEVVALEVGQLVHVAVLVGQLEVRDGRADLEVLAHEPSLGRRRR